MGATLSRVVAAVPVLDNCEFLRPPLGKWMGATLSRVVAEGPVLDNCGFLRPSWDG